MADNNWNLKTFDNMQNIAESAYHHRPKNFPTDELNDEQMKKNYKWGICNF